MKILYNIGHHGALILCLLHKNIYHYNDEAIFLYDSGMVPKGGKTYEFIQSMNKKLNYFGEIVVYSHSSIMGKTSEKEALNELKKLYDGIFSSDNMKLSSFDQVYITFDEWNPFGCYLNAFHTEVDINSILLSLRYGEYKGDYSYDTAVKWQAKRDKPVSVLHEKYNAYVWTDNIKNVYRIFETDKEYYYNMPFIDMDYMIDQLSQESLNELIALYRIEEIDIEKDDFYQLFISAGWFKEKLKEQKIDYIAFYQQLMDYFCDCKNVLLKQHPRHTIKEDDIKKYFPSVKCIVDSYIPSQLLCKYQDLKVRSILNFASGGTTGLEKKVMYYYFKKYWYIAPGREAFFWINKCYILFELASFLNYSNIRYFGLAVELMNDFYNYWSQFNFDCVKWLNIANEINNIHILPLGTMMILGKADWNANQTKEDIITAFVKAAMSNRDDILYALLDTSGVDVNTFPERVKKHIYQIEIIKRKDRDETRVGMERETIYIFSKNKVLLEKIKEFRTAKRLYNSGITIYTRDISRLSD